MWEWVAEMSRHTPLSAVLLVACVLLLRRVFKQHDREVAGKAAENRALTELHERERQRLMEEAKEYRDYVLKEMKARRRMPKGNK
jgi:hypothetical protein